MTNIVKNYLRIVKSKNPSEYPLSELHDLALDLITIYTYTSDQEDMEALRPIYAKIADWINSNKKGGFIVNHAALVNVDKRRDKTGVYNPSKKLDPVSN